MTAEREPALLRFLRAASGAADGVGAALVGADFDVLVRDAARHGLAGVARHALRAAGVELPRSADETLGHQALAGSAGAMRVKRLLLRALDALQARGSRPVLLKGFGLASRVYPDPLLRPTSDVDLLVAPEELEQACSVMLSLGLSPKVESDDFYPSAYQHHRSFAGPLGMVELHFRPMANWGVVWDAALLLSRAVSSTLEGRSVRYLRPEDELVYLALHAANHMLGRLGWLYDLRLFVRAYPSLDWSRVVATALEARMPGPAFYALDASRRLLGAGIPDPVLEALAPSRLTVAASRRLFSEQRLLDGTLSDHKAVWAAAKLLLADRPDLVALFALRRLKWNARRAVSRRLRRGWLEPRDRQRPF